MKVIALCILMLIAFASGNVKSLTAVTPQDVLGFFESFLEAAFGEEGEAAANCIENGEDIFFLFKKSIDEFKSANIQGVIAGLVHVGTALQELPQQFEDCEEGLKIVDDVVKIGVRIVNPATLAIDVGTAAIWNTFKILANGRNIVKNFGSGDLSAAGGNIGDIIHLIWGKSIKRNKARLARMTSPSQDSIDTVEGILVGAFGAEGKEAVVCLNDGEAIFADIEAAVKEFEKGGVTNIITGLYHIGEALEELPEEFKDCEQAEAIIADIEKIAAEFKDPKGLVIHVGEEVLWNGRDIYKDIEGASADFKEGKYEPAGEFIGDIIKLLLE